MIKDNQAPLMEPIDPFPNPKLCPTDAAGIQVNGARFGCSRNDGAKWHAGIDLKADVGTSFRAIYSGRIPVGGIRDLPETDPKYKVGVGNFIIVRSPNFSIKYCHLSRIDVAEGNAITANQLLGLTGKSGNAYPSTVPFKHLHIEVSTDHFATANNYVDPEPFLATKYGNNPNSPNHGDCPGLVEEELDFVKIEPEDQMIN